MNLIKISLLFIILSCFSACSDYEEPADRPPTLYPEDKVDFNGHEAILMVDADGDEPALYFATFNIGAENEEDAGYYFWWGDKDGHPKGSEFHFSYDNDDISTYGRDNKFLYTIGIITEASDRGVLTSDFDAASKLLGGSWHIPTKRDWQRLIDNCDWTWFTVSNVHYAGYEVSRKDGKGKIFLPAVGFYNGTKLSANSESGRYWSSSLGSSTSDASYIEFHSPIGSKGKGYSIGSINRYHGLSIRPVASSQ